MTTSERTVKPSDIGEIVRRRRKQFTNPKLTQDRLAQMVGVHRTIISGVENGDPERVDGLTVSQASKLAKALQLEGEELALFIQGTELADVDPELFRQASTDDE